MIINYKPREQELETGRLYTFDMSENWFMRVGQSDVIFIGSCPDPYGVLDTRSAAAHISCAPTWKGFRYDAPMDIKLWS